MRRLLLLASLLLALPAVAATQIKLLQFSDYHSHALPFYSEGRADQGGIARAIRYLKREKGRGALVFSGGDMINKGSPAWSDKYRCAEWSWFNGVLDAMALGNHDLDYGLADFESCRKQLRYPILSANADAASGFQSYRVFTVKGVRIGVFAVAGVDFKTLVKAEGVKFGDPVAAARQAVDDLRNKENVDVVVMIGHQSHGEDMALAKAVPGIDVIFGSHSHLKEELKKIDGTSTWFISPSQYLTYISRIELTVDKGRVTNVRGGLVRVDASMKSDPAIAARVAEMQRDLESDPKYKDLFTVIGTLEETLEVDALGKRVVRMMREAADASIALSTASTFRQPLPRGAVTMELLSAAMPYENEIVICEMRGDQLLKLMAFAETKRGTDTFPFIDSSAVIDAGQTYRVATTDFVARVAGGYRDFFGDCAKGTGIRVRQRFLESLKP